VSTRNLFHVLLDAAHHSLVHLDDLPRGVDQERSGQCQISVPIEQVTIEDVVDTGDVIGSLENLEVEPVVFHKLVHHLQLFRSIKIYAQNLHNASQLLK